MYASMAAALIAAFSEPCSASDIRVPLSGLVYDSDKMAVRPILGMPGAAVLGDPVDTGFPITAVAVGRNFALAVSGTDDGLYVVPTGVDGRVLRAVEAPLPSGTRLALSPSGAAAVVFSATGDRLQVVTGLPGTPVVSHDASTALIGAAAADVAVSDDGTAVLLIARDRVWLLDRDTGIAELPVEAAPAAVAFLANSRNAVIISRTGDLYRIAGGKASKYASIADAPDEVVGIQASSDATHTYVAYANGIIAIIDAQTGESQRVSCGCAATGVYAMNLPGWFRVNDVSGGPVMLVTAANSQPRVWFIPSALARERVR